MKKLLLLSLFALTSLGLSAQLELGISAGMNASEAQLAAQSADIQAVSGQNGLRLAGLIHLRSNKLISLQSEVALSQNTFSFERSDWEVRSLVASYLELPLMLRLNLKLWKLRVHVAAGPSGNLWTKGVQFDEIDGQISPQQAIAMGESFNRLNFSFNAAAGVGLALGPGWLELAARSSMGLTDVLASGPNTLFNGFQPAGVVIDKARSQVNMVSLSYFLSLGRK
jgi:hypothetical protein